MYVISAGRPSAGTPDWRAPLARLTGPAERGHDSVFDFMEETELREEGGRPTKSGRDKKGEVSQEGGLGYWSAPSSWNIPALS